jgi:hypothetical protein
MTRRGTKKAVVETHAAARNQRKRQAMQPTLTVLFTQFWHQQK